MIELTAPVVTFRTWALPLKGLELCSLGTKKNWVKGVNEAECKPPVWAVTLAGIYDPTHEGAPGENCMCGLHGATRLEETKKWVYDFRSDMRVTGAILQWGKMFSGGRVVRSSHAEVIALIDHKELARMYEVACVPMKHLESVAAEFGDVLTDEQIEELRCQDQT